VRAARDLSAAVEIAHPAELPPSAWGRELVLNVHAARAELVIDGFGHLRAIPRRRPPADSTDPRSRRPIRHRGRWPATPRWSSTTRWRQRWAVATPVLCSAAVCSVHRECAGH